MTPLPSLSPDQLISFEEDIASTFNAGQIRSPVHLSFGNEESLIEVFTHITPADYLFCSWRSHYHCLLKGVPPDILRSEILQGRSISLCFPEFRIFSSAIVGGVIPIALGAALALKLANDPARVFCFMGEMTAETGIAHESVKYARNHHLPITWVIEDNSKSVCTDSREAWGAHSFWWESSDSADVLSYRYTSRYPHAGAGKRVQF